MPQYRSRTTTHGRNMAGARALWRATGMKDGDFDKPIIAVCRSGSRSGAACKMLGKQGFEQVKNLRGGMMAWESANLPVKRK